ncbi:LAMA2-like protein [Mya arenaria]|uniref:LAMA2-like protein n=1 Tax=Mya arenaria TaxID=6604 RepID=A0ABY7DPP3_MYAAR|nr:LAMA2-like protein [Mya arenaria]
MDDYFRWTPREYSDRRDSIMKQTLIDDELMMDRWLKENQFCNEDYIFEERPGYFDRYQDEIYQIQQELYEKETQMQKMQHLYEGNIDDLERQMDELWTENAVLVEAKKRLERKLDRYDLDFKDQLKIGDKLRQRLNDEASKREHINVLLTTEQTKNRHLRFENSRLKALVGRNKNDEWRVTNQTKKVEEENQTLKHEIFNLKLEAAALRKTLITPQQRCDRMTKGREGNERDEWEQKSELFQAVIKELKIQMSSLIREKYSLQDELNRKGAELSRSFEKEIHALQQKITTYQHNEISSLKQNQENELALSQLKRQLISCEQENRLALEKIQKQEEEIRLLKKEKEKLIQDNRCQRTYHKETTMYSHNETERRELEIQRHKQALESAQQTQRVMKLEQRSKQAEDKLSVVNEQLHIERSRNDKLSKVRNQNAETSEKLRALKNELESEKSRNTILSKKIIQYEKNAEHQSEFNSEMKNELSRNTMISMERTKYEDTAETLQEVTKELESEKTRNAMLLKESNQYKKQIEKLKKAQVDLSQSYNLLNKENRQGQDIRIATEHNQQLKRNLSDLDRSKQNMIGEIGSLKDEVKKLTDALEEKDRDISMLKNELQMNYHEIEDKQGNVYCSCVVITQFRNAGTTTNKLQSNIYAV